MTPLIPIQEAARLLGISRSLLYQLCAEGKLPHLRVNSRVLFRVESLEEWTRAQEIAAKSGGAKA